MAKITVPLTCTCTEAGEMDHMIAQPVADLATGFALAVVVAQLCPTGQVAFLKSFIRTVTAGLADVSFLSDLEREIMADINYSDRRSV